MCCLELEVVTEEQLSTVLSSGLLISQNPPFLAAKPTQYQWDILSTNKTKPKFIYSSSYSRLPALLPLAVLIPGPFVSKSSSLRTPPYAFPYAHNVPLPSLRRFSGRV